jgi:dienelactone hydrolase
MARYLVRIAGGAFLILALACITCVRLQAQRSPLWGDLEKGPFAVGFKTVELYDHSRVIGYKNNSDGTPRRGERERPVQICVWYPARDTEDARTVVYGEYVFPNPADLRFFDLLAMLQAREIHDRILPALSNNRQVMLELMNMKCDAVRDAFHREGSFPLVIYNPGASSGISENVVMCEYLASHGYIVAATHSIGATFLYPEVDQIDLEALIRDGEFVLTSLRDWPHLDRDKLGLIGFGIGGTGALILQMRNRDVDAVVGLAGVHIMREHAGFMEGSLHYDPARLRVPVLQVCRADTGSIDTGVLDGYRYTDRYLLTVSGMEDIHFTGYGAISAMVPDTTSPPPETKRLAYETVCRYVLNFLRAHLDGDDEAHTFIDRSPRDNGIAAGFIDLVVKRRETAPPTEDRFIDIIIEEGIERARTVYEETRRGDAEPPFRQEAMNRLGVLYARMHQVDEGAEILRLNTQAYPGSASAWLSLGFTYLYTGRVELAEESLQKVLEVFPGDETLNETERDEVRSAAERGLEYIRQRRG